MPAAVKYESDKEKESNKFTRPKDLQADKETFRCSVARK